MESVGSNKLKKKLSFPEGKSVSIEDLEKLSEGYDIAYKNLAKRKKQTLNMNTIRSKLQSEEGPKECHDHSSSSKHSVTRKKVRNQAQKIGYLCKEKKGSVLSVLMKMNFFLVNYNR